MSVRRVIISADANQDLRDVRQWLLQPGSGHAALRRHQSLVRAIKGLNMNPFSHPRGDSAETRELIVHGYVVIYRVASDQADGVGDVQVLKVFGPGQSRSPA